MNLKLNILFKRLVFKKKNREALLLIITLLLFIQNTLAQQCTSLGQNPSTAFPVCASSVFFQNSVPICGTREVISGCNTGTQYFDKNPYWYKFKCYTTGTLGFVITPIDLTDDYDWQLYDITNKNPQNLYTDISMFVACNWSGEVGKTGASAAGVSLVNCDGGGVPVFSSMPTLIQGHEYLLLVSHFTNSQSGYALSFEGGTAGIIDPKDPHLSEAKASCIGNTIEVAINKKIKCNTLNASGLEFKIQPPSAKVISAIGKDCSIGFDCDIIILVLDKNLPTGDYTLNIGNSPDGNTLLDNCERPIPAGEFLPLKVSANPAPTLSSIKKQPCAPQLLEIEFSKPVLCSSIDRSGSEFTITGNYPVTISKVKPGCTGDSSLTLIIELSAPLQQRGNFNLNVITGNDGNTLLDNCGKEIPNGSSFPFTIYDTVNANFQFILTKGCEEDIVNYLHDGKNEVNSWTWKFNDQPGSNSQNPIITYKTTGIKETELIVSNGFCSDTSKAPIYKKDIFKSDFESVNVACPGDKILFKDKSTGEIINWYWEFGNGKTSNSSNPPEQTYLPASFNYSATVKLIVTNTTGCKDTSTFNLPIISNCSIVVPSSFTPNNDGLNDYFYPLNAYRARNLKFSVYNRFGQLIFFTQDWTKKWNGKFRGAHSDGGVYVWLLSYTDVNNNKVDTKGTVLLIR